MARRPRTQSTAVLVDVPDTGGPLSAASPDVGLYEILPDEEEEKLVVDELLSEYFDVVENTQALIAQHIKYEKMAAGKKLKSVKNTPYPNASNAMIPFALIVVQNTAGFIKTLFNRRPLVTVSSIKKEAKDIQRAKTITKYLDILNSSKNDVNAQKQMRTVSSQVAKLGTCFVKVPFRKQLWSFKKSPSQQVNAVKRLGPAMIPIPFKDVLYPEGYDSLQDCPWMCHMIHIPKFELLQRKHDGVYEADKVDLVVDAPSTTLDDSTREAYQNRFRSDQLQELYDIGEFYKYHDVDNDGSFEDIILHVHIQTGTVLKKQVNPMGNRMFVPVGFINNDFAIPSRGVCETLEDLQDAINGVHNMRYDNMKVANLRMLAVKKIGNVNPHEQAYPGKVWRLPNPREDIVPIQFGEVYPSSVNEERMLQDYGQQATMMPDIRSGFADQTLKSRDTFSGQGLRLQQSQGLFDAITEGVSESIAQINEFILYQLIEHKDEVIAMEKQLKRLTDSELSDLNEVLSIPVEEVPLRLSLAIQTTELDKTYEAQVQSLQMLVQVYTNWAEKITPLAFELFGPQGQQLQQQAPDAYQNQLAIYVGATRMMSEIMDFFGKQDTDAYLPNIDKQEALLKIMNMMSSQQAKQLNSTQQMMEQRLLGMGAGGAPTQNPAQLAGDMVTPQQVRPFSTIGGGGAAPQQGNPVPQGGNQ